MSQPKEPSSFTPEMRLKLWDRLRQAHRSWLPTGDVYSIAVTPEEWQLLLSELSPLSETLPKDATNVERLWLAVRVRAEGSDWNRDGGEALYEWADRKLAPSSATNARDAIIEECADLADQHLDEFSRTYCSYRTDVAQAIRALKGKP